MAIVIVVMLVTVVLTCTLFILASRRGFIPLFSILQFLLPRRPNAPDQMPQQDIECQEMTQCEQMTDEPQAHSSNTRGFTPPPPSPRSSEMTDEPQTHSSNTRGFTPPPPSPQSSTNEDLDPYSTPLPPRVLRSHIIRQQRKSSV